VSPSKASNIVELRQLLAEKFPGTRMAAGNPPRIAGRWQTGLPQFDALLDGGLAKSAITEIVSPGVGSGSALLIGALLRQARENGQWMALIDAVNSFDAAAYENDALSRLLWVRCSEVREGIKAADIVLQDGSMTIAVLDMTASPVKEVRRTKASTWFRLQRIVEATPTAFVVMTPRPVVNNAEIRLSLERQFGFESLETMRDLLEARISPRLLAEGEAIPREKIA
jgi:hypothetical protein